MISDSKYINLLNREIFMHSNTATGYKYHFRAFIHRDKKDYRRQATMIQIRFDCYTVIHHRGVSRFPLSLLQVISSEKRKT